MLLLQGGTKCVLRLIIAMSLIAVATYATTSSVSESLFVLDDHINRGVDDIPQTAKRRSSYTYEELLDQWPIVTKSITSGIIGFAGDYLAQVAELHYFKSRRRFDHYRAFCVSIEGFLVSGPIMHIAFEFLADFTNEREDATEYEKWIIALEQVVLDSVFLSCFFVATLMIVTAVLEGRTRKIPEEFRLEYWNGCKGAWLTSLGFIPIQTISFRYTPLSFRVLAMNLQDCVWNAVVSYIAHRSRKPEVKVN